MILEPKKLAAAVAMALVLPAAASAQGYAAASRQGAAPPAVSSAARQDALIAEDQAQQQAAISRRQRAGEAWIPPRASLMRNGKHWIGPAYRQRDLDLARPWQRGRFSRGIGPDYLWLLQGGNRERFNLGGTWFSLAPVDYARAHDWRWNNDNIVLYPDPAHIGWYRAYNVRIGNYTHVMYLGDAPVATPSRRAVPQRVASAGNPRP